MDKKRFQEMEQRAFYLWGHTAEVVYSFFDHKLYEYFVSLTSGEAFLDTHKEIMTALEARAGVAQPDTKAGPETLYAYNPTATFIFDLSAATRYALLLYTPSYYQEEVICYQPVGPWRRRFCDSHV